MPFSVEMDYEYFPKVRDFSIAGRNRYLEMIINDRMLLPRIQTLSRNISRLDEVTLEEPFDKALPYWNNGWFPPLDGIALYALIVSNRPSTYLEVGSGNSTKFAKKAVRDFNLNTKIISIDPMPRAEIDQICDRVVRSRFEDTDLSIFSQLSPNDMVFIDNSHRSFQGSDVTVFFTEALPRINKGVVWGLHDIFLPFDYVSSWASRFYNEQYLLMAYLLGGSGGDTIELPVHFIEKNESFRSPLLAPLQSKAPMLQNMLLGGSFWLRKG